MKDHKKDINIRKAIQSSFLVIMIFLTLYMINGTIGSAHQFCPYSAVCFGAMYPRGIITYSITIIISILILISTIFIGRKFCSYVCFLGTIQEKLYIFNRNNYKEIVPQKLHKILSLLKYLVLLFTVIFAILLIQYSYFKFCPVLSISFISRIGLPSAIFLTVFVVFSFFIERVWCRYLCPYGALMNLFQYIGKFLGIKRLRISRNIAESINCKNCKNYCPMGIDIGDCNEGIDPNCVHCLKCVRVCLKSKASDMNCIYKDNL